MSNEEGKPITTQIAEGAGKAVESVKNAFSGAAQSTEETVTDAKHGAQNMKQDAEHTAEKKNQ